MSSNVNGRPPRLHVPLFAAVLLSAAAHAAVVLIADARAPLATSMRTAPTSAASTMHMRLVAATPAVAAQTLHASVKAPDRPRIDAVSAPPPATTASNRQREAHPPAPSPIVPDAPPDEARQDERPTPLTYPVISLPPDDDPHRIGLVRLLLVVSSEGQVVKTIVTAATLSQDYVEHITRSFEDVRFRPASAHGFPRAGWYEVVVDLAFDPEARTSF